MNDQPPENVDRKPVADEAEEIDARRETAAFAGDLDHGMVKQ
jgi:hypothetical protein